MESAWTDWRDEQEQVSRDAAAVRRHGLDVRDRLREAMARGDRVWVVTSGTRIVGQVIEVDDDLLSLRTLGGRTDIRLDPVPRIAIGSVEVAAGSGRTPPLSSGGFRGRLLDAETSGADYVVGVADGELLEGRVLVGRDHVDVLIDDEPGSATTVTLPMISFVRRSALR